MDDETRYKLLRTLQSNPDATQRELARTLGVSVGKLNYCLRGLITKGLVKAKNFRQSENKKAYMYLLTPKGIEEKARVTAQFLKRRLREYAALEQEIEQLRQEAAQLNVFADAED